MPTPATRYRSDDLTGGFTPADPPAIFWSPHADDETISYGIQACNHADDGRSVLIVLNTQGASAGMLDILNGGLPDNSQPRVRHDPVLEHYRPDYLVGGRVTSDTAGRSRWDEFQTAVGAMNRAYPGRVRAVTLGLEEGSSVAVITQELREMIARFPGADHKGYSYTDTNPDHAAVGVALCTLGEQGFFGADHPPRFAVAPDERLQIARNAGLDVHTVEPHTPLVLETVHRAAQAYGGWNPVAGAFGFGKKSSKLVTEAETATVGYEHYWEVETLRKYFKLYDGPRLRHLAQTVITASPRLATPELPDAQSYKLDQRVTPELVAELAAAYKAGESTIALAKRYSLGRKSIASLLAEAGVELRWTRLTTEQVDRACTLYLDDGLSLATIAELVGGGSQGSVSRSIRSRGVQLRSRGGSKHRKQT